MPYPHMPTGAQPTGSSRVALVVTYVAVGGELDFNVPIGSTMVDTNYGVTSSPAGGTSGDGSQTSGAQTPDMPFAGRTTTQFRVVFGQPLTAGDKFQFIVAGLVA